MYTIGEFAALGRVSVRMLRHYDAIGLLEPAHVDPGSGYRRYSNDQLPSLLLIAELRELGVGLERIAEVLGSDARDAALRDALAARRTEIEASLAVDTARLARIDRRLRRIEGEVPMPAITYRTIDPITVYALGGVAPGMGPEHVGPVVGPLIERLDDALTRNGRPMIPPGVFWYEAVEGSEELAVHVSYQAEPQPRPGEGYDVVELPSVTVAALLHRGDMTTLGESWQALFTGLVEDGYRICGPTREVYLEAEGHEPGPDWVTELQAPVERVK